MKKLLLITICLLLIISGCTSSDTQKTENNIVVVTSFYPVYVLAKNITDGIDGVTVENMAQPKTGCLHDYQLTTKDRKMLEKADLFLTNGAGMEPFLNGVKRQYAQLPIVDTSEGVTLLSSEHHHNHNHHEEEELYNGHIWLSSQNAFKQAENICNALSKKDTAHAQQYQKNLEIFRDKIESFQNTNNISSQIPKKVMIFHEGFAYIAQEYNLSIEGEVLAEENITPSAKELAELIDHAKKEEINLFFAADDAGKPYAELIAKEVGGTVYLLDPITSGKLDKNAYFSAIQKNRTILQEALKQ